MPTSMGNPTPGNTAQGVTSIAPAAGPARPVVTVAAPPSRSVTQLLASAHSELATAALARRSEERYAAAHLAGLRAAAAVVARRAQPVAPGSRRAKPTSVWVLLAALAPELAEWAQFFAAGASKRHAAEIGLPNAVTPREADDLLRDAESFVSVVETTLGIAGPGPTLAATG
ncbi:MAG: SAV_6107 family HEPN domain-containing protein [Mycobacteriales bacterium]